MNKLASLYPAVLIPFLTLALAGQTPTANWDNVRAITPGTMVRVTVDNPLPIRGKLDSVSDSALLLNPGGGQQSLSRPRIVSVSVSKKGHRARNTLIGLGAGLAAGLGIGIAVTSNCTSCAFHDYAVALVAGLGGAGGTLVGTAWPTGGWRQVYQQ